MLQGFSLGGEIGPTPPISWRQRRPSARVIVSWQGASQMIAILVGGLVGVLLSMLCR